MAGLEEGQVTPHYQQAGISLHCADIMDALPTFAEASFDACFCDAPYEYGFMSKQWDKTGIAFQPETWREIYRTLKPGAPLLVFGGTRTHHRLMCAVEDAGFEIRDCLMWLYGSGFPKSTAIDKQIDKRGGNAHLTAQIGAAIKRARLSRNLTAAECDALFCGGTTNWSWFEGRPAGQRIPTADTFNRIVAEWPELAPFAEVVAEVERENLGPGRWHCEGRKAKAARFDTNMVGEGDGKIHTAPATDAAKRWNGWGTSLKPAFEILVLAMKPCEGTFAESALRHGVAGLNIDGCRIPTAEALTGGGSPILRFRGQNDRPCWGEGYERVPTVGNDAGRWPANLVLSCACDGDHEPDCPVRMLDEQSGPTSSKPRIETHSGRADESQYRIKPTPGTIKDFGDSGGASRYFYCAKASRAERGEGNNHPTVKPLKLCEYLARLILPPARETPRRLLVPFSGSGSEMIGAQRAGWDEVVGIEIDQGYCKVAEARLDAEAPPLQRELVRCDAELAEARQLLLEGHPDVPGLTLALNDWSEERRMVEAR